MTNEIDKITIDDITNRYNYTEKDIDLKNDIYSYYNLLENLFTKFLVAETNIEFIYKVGKLRENIFDNEQAIKKRLNSKEEINEKKKLLNLKLKEIEEMKIKVNEISIQHDALENKAIEETVFNQDILRNLAKNYLKNKKDNEINELFHNMSKKIIEESIKGYIKYEKNVLLLYEQIRYINI